MNLFLKRLIVYAVTPLITIVLAVLKTPFGEDIKCGNVVIFNFLEIFAIAGTAFVYVFNVLIPYRKYEISQERKYKTIGILLDDLDKKYPDFKLSMNIMLVRRGYFLHLEPSKRNPQKARFTLTEKVFKIVRHFGHDGTDERLRITVNQGVCGAAFREGKKVSVQYIVSDVFLPDVPRNINSNFTQEQERLTEQLKVVISCPLMVVKNEGDEETNKCIGVLNVESTVEEMASIFLDTEARDEIYGKIVTMAKIFCTLHI